MVGAIPCGRPLAFFYKIPSLNNIVFVIPPFLRTRRYFVLAAHTGLIGGVDDGQAT